MSQPKVEPLPANLNLTGLIAVITGSTSGLGLESARQLLQHGASTVILAIRNLSKGNTIRSQLLSDPLIHATNPSATIELLELDVSSDASIISFASTLTSKFPIVNLLMLNAGSNVMKYTTAPNGHELSLQVYHLSNALLINLLLPQLQSSTKKSGRVSRITITGSRYGFVNPTTLSTHPISPAENIITHFDDPSLFSLSTNYADAKLLVYLFTRELARRIDPGTCTINSFCPGMVDTNFTDYLPWYMRGPVALFKAYRARSVQVGGWIALNAAVVVRDGEAHGRFYWDKEVKGVQHKVCDGMEGERLGRRVYADTMGWVGGLVEVVPGLEV